MINLLPLVGQCRVQLALLKPSSAHHRHIYPPVVPRKAAVLPQRCCGEDKALSLLGGFIKGRPTACMLSSAPSKVVAGGGLMQSATGGRWIADRATSASLNALELDAVSCSCLDSADCTCWDQAGQVALQMLRLLMWSLHSVPTTLEMCAHLRGACH